MSKDDIDEKIKALINKVNELELAARETKEELATLLDSVSNKKSSSTAKVADEDEDRGRPTDRYGVPLRIGSKVRFLTKGRYNSKEGVITNVGSIKITARDSKGNRINRNFNNVEVIDDV